MLKPEVGKRKSEAGKRKRLQGAPPLRKARIGYKPGLHPNFAPPALPYKYTYKFFGTCFVIHLTEFNYMKNFKSQ